MGHQYKITINPSLLSGGRDRDICGVGVTKKGEDYHSMSPRSPPEVLRNPVTSVAIFLGPEKLLFHFVSVGRLSKN